MSRPQREPSPATSAVEWVGQLVAAAGIVALPYLLLVIGWTVAG